MLKRDVIDHFGSALKAAKALGISHQAIYKWRELVPERMAYRIHAKTRGRLKANPEAYAAPRNIARS